MLHKDDIRLTLISLHENKRKLHYVPINFSWFYFIVIVF